MVNSKDVKDENSMEKQLVKTEISTINVKANQFTYRFPAHSFTMIQISESVEQSSK
ncbi:MAG: hypothetical protein ACK5JD_09960 [Mangrovibacterium sp.]